MSKHHPIAKRLVAPVETYSASPHGETPQQILAFAESRVDVAGNPRLDETGNPDLSGLVLHQDHLTYVVDQHVVVEPVVDHEPTGPRQYKPWRRATTLVFSDLGTRKMEPYRREKKLTVIDLDVYDAQGRLISKTSYGGIQDFMTFLDAHGKGDQINAGKKAGRQPSEILRPLGRNSTLPRGQFTAMGWAASQPKPLAELKGAERREIQEIEIPLHGKDPVLDQVFRHHERLDLPGSSLYGLTMKRGGHTFQVTQDVLVHTPDPKSPRGTARMKIARTWEITEYDERGRRAKQKKNIYTGKELADFLDQGGLSDLHWEISKDALRNSHQTAKIGQVAIRADDGSPGSLPEFEWVDDLGSRDISINDAMLAFHSPDLYDEEEVWERATTPRKQHDYDLKFAKSLQKIIRKFGTNEVAKVAEQLRHEYEKAAGALGLPLPEEKSSISWALWDIAEQHYYTEHHQEADATRQTGRFGVKVGEALGKGRAVRLKQREIIDYEIGLAFADEAIEAVLDGEAFKHVDEDGLIGIENRATVIFMPNDALIGRLQDFVRIEVEDALHRIADDKNAARRPSRADLVILGRRLRRQVQQ